MLLRKFFPPALRTASLLLLALLPTARAQTLYDPSTGSLPETQGWAYAALGTPVEMISGDSALLDTTSSSSIEAGWTRLPADLNRAKGFSLRFQLLVNSEAHASVNRAGFSVIVLGDDKLGIELGFWTNTIFAQSDSPLFTHAEQATFPTNSALVNYSLTLQATNYVLTANGTDILSGPIRNYTSFSGFPNPYSTPDFVFFGDDTTSANASCNLGAVTLILAPTLTTSAPGSFSWIGVSNQTYSVQSSTDLITWNPAGTVTSANDAFQFSTNQVQSRQFFRVAFP